MSTSSARTSSSSTELIGPAKLEDVTKIIDKLTADLIKPSLLPHQRDALLEQLKVYGRDPTNADPIFTKEGIETLTRHAYSSPSKTTSRNALRCLANALLLRPDTRQIYVDLGYEAAACSKLKDGTPDDEFLISRILFLTTYNTNLDYEKLIDEHHLADNLTQIIAKNGKQYFAKQKKVKELDPTEDMALIETLKLFFNVTHFCPQRSGAFSQAIPHILIILAKRPIIQSKPLEPPIAQLVNALLNLPLEERDNISALFPKVNLHFHAERLVEILDYSIKIYKDDDLESLVTPVLALIRKLNEIGPKEAQNFLRHRLLPTQKDREKPVGKGESLSARLIRLSTNITTPQIRENVSGLLFELSDKDARHFVQNVGYGFASGFLVQHNVPIPENAFEAWSTNSSEGNTRTSQDSGKAINPITGQTLESEAKMELPEMTNDEKEREAEKLFVLFERLKKNGIITAQNPVEEALSQGRFLELDDDADSE